MNHSQVLILAGGKEIYHDVLRAGKRLQEILLAKGVLAHLSQDFTILNSDRIFEYDSVIFYTQEKILTKKEQKGLTNFIEQGHGFIPVHSANVIHREDQEQYLKTVGSKFEHHEPFCRFKVEIKEKKHFITDEISSFKIEDELYESRILIQPDSILAQAEQKGEYYPMVYTRNLKKGKICYLALGHDGRAWDNPNFQKLLNRSVIWCSNNV